VTLTLIALHNPVWRFPLLWNATLILAGGAVTLSGFQYLSRALLWLNQQDEEEPLPASAEPSSRNEEKRRRYSA
jgi:hypothetical protein